MDPHYQLERRESRRDMEAIGRNIGETKKNLAQRRIKQGRCPTCGTKTHKVGFFGKKTALTVEGQALYGRCLICEPVEGYVKRPQYNGLNHYDGDDYYDGHRQLPPGTELMFSDDNTLVSGITMEPGLVDYARQWETMGDGDDNLARWDEDDDEEEGESEEKSHRRPEPSVASFDCDRPAAPQRRRSSDLRPQPIDMIGEGSERQGRKGQYDLDSSSRHGGRNGRVNHFHREIIEEEEAEKLPEQIFAEQMEMAELKNKVRTARPLTPPRSMTPQNDKDSSSSPKPSSPDSKHVPKYQEVEFDVNIEPQPSVSSNRKSFSEEEEAKNEIEAPFRPQWSPSDPVFAYNSTDMDRSWVERDATPFTSNSTDSREGRHEQAEMPLPALDGAGLLPEVSPYMESHHSRSTTMRSRHLATDFNASFSPGTSPVINTKSNVKQQRAPSTPLEPINVEAANGYGGPSNTQARSAHSRLVDDSPGEPPLVKYRGTDTDLPGDPASPKPPTAGNRKNEVHVSDKVVEQLSLSPLLKKALAHADNRLMDSPGGGSVKPESVDDVPTILHCLNLDQATARMREKACLSLAHLVWIHGGKVKTIIAKYKGIETLVNAMWANMDDALVQEAATQYLFALAASADGVAGNDVLAGESAEGAVDALLIAMQSHISVEAIQRDGCGTLCCLATAASNNKNVDDGTASGAVMIVLQAMDTHRKSIVVQEWGVRALYAQCVHSRNTESNKRSLVQSDFERNVLLRALDVCKSDVTATEWVCRLFWCLTSHQEVSRTLSNSPALLYSILDILQSYHRKPDAAGLTEAAFAIIANLSFEESLKREIQGSGISSAVVDSMKFYRNHEGLHVEACGLLSNLATEPSSKENIVRAGGVPAIIGSMMTFHKNADLIEEALRALVSLTIGSDDAKAGVASPEILGALLRVCEEHLKAAPLQELLCTFLAVLSFRTTFECVVFSTGGPQTLVKVMNANPFERKLQEAACIAFRNIACNEDDTSDLLRREIISALTKAMANHEDSEIVQRNVCCAFWNIVFKATEEPESVLKCDGMNHMVKAMLSHLESGALQEMACGAIWSLLDESDERKMNVFGNGGIEAVTCALVMHPEEPATLETACGVLSSLSVISQFANAIAQAQGVSGVVEAMRNNSSSVSVLEYGMLTLRNIIAADPEYADEAIQAISIIINGMKDYPDAVSFQEEACYTLWVMAAVSDSCRSRILALDGVTAIIGTMDHNSCVSDVQEAARGAFNQLAASNNLL